MSAPMIQFTKEVKAKWLTALRSGEYTQGNGVLCGIFSNGSCRHCCLGVLGDIEGLLEPKEGWTRKQVKGSGRIGETYHLYDGDHSYVEGLPIPVQERLALMNDEGKSFADIADYIERAVPAIDDGPRAPSTSDYYGPSSGFGWGGGED